MEAAIYYIRLMCMSHLRFKGIPPYSQAIRYDDPSANSALTGFRQRKRLKKLENAPKAGSQKELAAALGLPIPATNAKDGKEPAHESDHPTNEFDQLVLEGPAEGL